MLSGTHESSCRHPYRPPGMNSHTRCPSSLWVTLQQRTNRLEAPAACNSCAPTLLTPYNFACSAAQRMLSAPAVHLCHPQGIMPVACLCEQEAHQPDTAGCTGLLHITPP